MSGTHSISSEIPHYLLIARALCTKFKEIGIGPFDISVEGRTWAAHKNATICWDYKKYQKLLDCQVPLDILVTNGSIHVQLIDFNVNTISWDKVPQSLVRKKLHVLNDPKLWLSNLGVLNVQDEKSEKRLGFCDWWDPAFSDVLANWWDIPNDVDLIQEEFRCDNFIESGFAVHLPFVSLPFTLHPFGSVAMPFDNEDFLPNPKKRRELLRLVKKMDTDILETYFTKQQVTQYM
jgi:hypothetical protein